MARITCSGVKFASFSNVFLIFQYQTRSSANEMEAYSVAGKQAEEVLKSVKTVVAFAGEEKEIERFASSCIKYIKFMYLALTEYDWNLLSITK